jgi:tetratricopeptide (TPR) repeat protein
MSRCFSIRIVLLLALAASLPTHGQSSGSQADAIIVKGSIQTPAGQPLADASVALEQPGESPIQTTSNTDGTFILKAEHPGNYLLRAVKPGWRTAVTPRLTFSVGEERHINLVLEDTEGSNNTKSSADSPVHSPALLELHDEPNFVVEGITDGTNFGGHGSDTRLRASEALTKETLALKSDTSGITSADSPALEPLSPEAREVEIELRKKLVVAPGSFDANYQLGNFYFRLHRYRQAAPLLESAYRINSKDYAGGYELARCYEHAGEFSQAREQARKMLATFNTAELHHLLGDLNERLDDPLGAVREYEQAARLEPNEQNYFDWAAELLLHRAPGPAAQVFAKGVETHPNSSRMLAGLGTAFYVNGSYNEAALRLCAASDLNPTNTVPYILLGKMEKATSDPLPCVEQKLARFVRVQPQNAMANYYYAMVLSKQKRGSRNAVDLRPIEALLNEAVRIDPKFDEAFLALGVLHFEQGNFEGAIYAYLRALEVNPLLAEAHYRLGLAYKRVGQETKAQQEFQRYQQVSESDAAALERQRREVRQYLINLKGQR